MLGAADTSGKDSDGRAGLAETMTGQVTGGDASSPALTAVIVCMTIMAVCAVFYFAIRYYFEERRWRAGAVLCKCLPPGTVATLSTIECANACRYNEKRAVNVGVQTIESPIRWPVGGDVRMTDARHTGRKYASPVNNNDAIPHWRPPATGSSQRHVGSSRTSHKKQQQQQQRYFVHHSTQYPSEASYPLRRSRNISMMPSVMVQSASSSDSYSHLTSSVASKAPPIKDKMHALNYSASDEEIDCRMLCPRDQHDVSGLTDPLVYGTSPFHPRNNTPVSELMGNEDELSAVLVNVEKRTSGREGSAPGSDASQPLDEAGYEEDASSEAESGDRKAAPRVSVADGATQICRAIDDTVPLKSGQAASNCSVGAGRPASLDAVRPTSRLPSRTAFPSFELLPGGRLVTRWTQTDNASVMSLDWDHYGVEVGVDAALNTDVDMITDAGTGTGADSVDHDAGMSSATLLMVSHTSADNSHHHARHNSTNQRSSSPYVLCYMCSGEYGVDERRRSVTNVNGVTTINIGQAIDFDAHRSSPIGRPPSAPPQGASFIAPTPPDRQRRRSTTGSRTAPRPSRT